MNTIKIGNQEWMQENLNLTDEGLGKDHWKDEKTGEVYYSWDAAMRIAKSIPEWHLPTAEEWNAVAEACGATVGDNKLQDDTYMQDYENAENLYDTLKVLPVGYSNVGSFYYVGSFAYFWSATEYCIDGAYLRGFNTSGATEQRISHRNYGVSVRLVKD